ncbi:hypothetical protein Zm00014a_019210 [Zea mays]|uniref:Ras guanine nucleotide exchange factor K n=2 Tax=Zea mays TaxID=4577 RepID=B6SUZ0_MAIZE|nr:uncharacterized protein LOC100275536 [Zea mays]ACG28673.1 hypothetical protein [Zea mays]AQK51274.1 Ras guanine nucleotide exchange factor K [Zea mays]PWZ27241.1 hypothetical protein Zm00014a_019210 [Zea mays]|eukprot:NP_001143064.1 uncharacterized protein LOC100275536 [Zea mays]
MDSESEEQGSSPETESDPPPSPSQLPLLLNPAYARCKSVVHDELRSFRVFLQWCALDHSTCAGRAASYAVFVALALLVPAAVSLSLRADTALSRASASAIAFNRVAQAPATGLAVVSFATLAAFFRRFGGLRQLLFLDGALRDDTAFVRRGYARELDRAFRTLAALLLPSLCVEAAHKAVFFFCTVRVEPPAAVLLPFATPPLVLPWRAVALVATVASWVYRTGVFLLVCVLFRLTCELQILRFEGIYRMFDVEARPTAAEIFAEHRRIRTQLLATSHRYRVFILCCLVTITISQLGALIVVLSSRDAKSFSNTGDLVVGSAVQLSGFFMCLLGAARITHRAQRIVSIASQWHMSLESSSTHNCKSSSASDAVDASSHVSGSSTAAVSQLAEPSAPCSYSSRQALVTYLRHNGGGITLFGFTLDRGLLHTIFVFEMTLVLWILSKVVVF